eukprot:TRINITY_DN6951_c0_g1_i2.p1 TRINITY_DN6951_c0_g1~~TRINITY_DN6951_c0_g1_i2.p1  ORF type:complete len:261 (+),score=77.30 TRINITY_DN6951_c0_g1_i2:82-864(+)
MSYLTDFVELVDDVPREMKTIMSSIRKLDTEASDVSDLIDKKSKKFFREGKHSQQPQRKAQQIEEVKAEYERAKGLCEEKLQLAGGALDMIERVCKYLDSKVNDFRAELEASHPDLTVKLEKRSLDLDHHYEEVDEDDDDRYAAYTPTTTASTTSQRRTATEAASSGLRERSTRKKTSATAAATYEEEPAPAAPAEAAATTEETYCVCKGPSYGQMIGCDDDNCPIEWYHYKCVGLTEEPKGDWYCFLCTERRKREGLPV